MKKQLALVLLFALSAMAFCAEPTADAVMAKAQAEAKAGKKNVMVIFHASWCGWCHKLDDFLKDPEMGKVMKANYVIVHLDVLESAPDKKPLENAGGLGYMTKWGGENAGLPFTAIVDPSGKLLITSNKEKTTGNIGYPAQPEEIGHFMAMLKATAPKMKASDQTKIETWLKEHAPK